METAVTLQGAGEPRTSAVETGLETAETSSCSCDVDTTGEEQDLAKAVTSSGDRDSGTALGEMGLESGRLREGGIDTAAQISEVREQAESPCSYGGKGFTEVSVHARHPRVLIGFYGRRHHLVDCK
ncbi:hypothetical protein V5799_012970 [Amblyomma americanum]|uniref:Uncharacterized protein n=1 Tax=Amblyomma americanum TaxID=6943 RepID=A0AAQ4E796_AMBAM